MLSKQQVISLLLLICGMLYFLEVIGEPNGFRAIVFYLLMIVITLFVWRDYEPN